MWSLTIQVLIVFFSFVETGKIPRNLFNMDSQETMLDDRRHRVDMQQDDSDESEDYQLGITSSEDKTKLVDENKNPCEALYLSGNYNSVQSLLRKYRYDSHGTLIPTSVKYYLKSLDPDSGKPHLVQLHDKSFSTSGGFIKYYKAVPPVPQYYSPL